MKELYLSGDYEALKSVLEDAKGVASVVPVRATGRSGGELEGARVEFDPKRQDIGGILEAYFSVINPYSRTDGDEKKARLFCTSAEDSYQLEYYARFLASRGREPGAALGELIVNDSIRSERYQCETRRLSLGIERLHEYTLF